MANNPANPNETFLNALSGQFVRWLLPILGLSGAGWAWNAETRLKELESLKVESARQATKIENLEKRVENLPVIEERIQNIRDTLKDIQKSLEHP